MMATTGTITQYAFDIHLIDKERYEITVSLKGASASMGTFTQSQTSYLPREVMWGYRFPSVVSYDRRKQKYVIDHKKLNFMEQVDTPLCSGNQLSKSFDYPDINNPTRPGSPGSFSKQLNDFHLQRTSSFKHNKKESKV
ncbi:ATP-sensitive inward rectifier potassium channel 11 [Eumeta japonica]|uniref:ATP-sensitive inward rectifier potassium channel 11 n=1 Tax=Eumeta variegata TaxID=151549 RepID=A0A4C1SQT3_EUMVA|nr:ATP-sensitive inward rectifier potassium channel 11 [Eumeta japonica]